jgi:MSHA biogenesis protein MshK
MARSVNHGVAVVFALCLAGLPASVLAQVLDPTQPPPGIMQATPSGEAAATPATPLLQSVMITPTGKYAIIGGETVKLGGKYRDSQVVKINETEVELRSANGSETLRMFPDVELKPVRPEAATPSAKPKRKVRSTNRERQGPPR